MLTYRAFRFTRLNLLNQQLFLMKNACVRQQPIWAKRFPPTHTHTYTHTYTYTYTYTHTPKKKTPKHTHSATSLTNYKNEGPLLAHVFNPLVSSKLACKTWKPIGSSKSLGNKNRQHAPRKDKRLKGQIRHTTHLTDYATSSSDVGRGMIQQNHGRELLGCLVMQCIRACCNVAYTLSFFMCVCGSLTYVLPSLSLRNFTAVSL